MEYDIDVAGYAIVIDQKCDALYSLRIRRTDYLEVDKRCPVVNVITRVQSRLNGAVDVGLNPTLNKKGQGSLF